MNIQDKIDEALQAAKEAKSAMEELGYQWQQTNAHAKAGSIIMGMMATGEELKIPLDPEQLQRLETAGCDALFKTIPMPVYTDLIMHLLPQPGDDEEEDDEE